jgi:hypothetical protein
MTPRQTPRLNARSLWYRWLLRVDRERPRHGRAAEQVMNFRRLMVLPFAQTAHELRTVTCADAACASPQIWLPMSEFGHQVPLFVATHSTDDLLYFV